MTDAEISMQLGGAVCTWTFRLRQRQPFYAAELEEEWCRFNFDGSKSTIWLPCVNPARRDFAASLMEPAFAIGME